MANVEPHEDAGTDDGRPVRDPDGPVSLEALDLSLAALFVGYALAEEVAEHIRAAGHPDLRVSHGFLFQHLVPGPASVSDIARVQGVTTQAISQQLRELEDLGYVERSRDRSDRRVRVVALTGWGRSAVAAAREARDLVHTRVATAVGEERVATATDVLRDVLVAVEAAANVTARRVRPPT